MRCGRRQVQVLHGDLLRIDDAWRERLAAIGVAPGADWTTFTGDRLVSTSLATKCYRVDLADAQAVYFKRYVYPPRFWLEFWLRPAKAAVECWAYSRLAELGIPTLEVIAFAERRRLGMLLASGIVTRGVPDAIDLETFAREVWCHWPRERRRDVARAIAQRLLTQAGRAHRGGFFHHDLKWRNLLIARSGDPDSLVWIDAPRASRMRWRERRGIVTDLSGLARVATSLFSRTELMRFLRIYLGDGAGRAECRQLFAQVARHLGRRQPRPLVLSYPD